MALDLQIRLFELPDIKPPCNFRRALLKLSGEALMGSQESGVDADVIRRFAQEIVIARQDLDVELAVVVGGGNFWRGKQHPEMDRNQADFAGMLATVINGLCLQDHLEKLNQPTRVMSAISMEKVAEPYIRRRAIRHLEKGRVVILAGGTGNPTFTTDTAAALRSVEIEAEVLLMAKNGVDGVYSADPKTNPDAVRYKELTYLDIINDDLKVMDPTAATHAMENHLPIVVFDGLREGGLEEALVNPYSGTVIK